MAASQNIASELIKFIATKSSSCKISTRGRIHRFEERTNGGRGEDKEQGQEVAALLQNTPHAEMHVKPAINSHFSAFARDGRELTSCCAVAKGTSSLAVCLPTSYLNDAS